MGKEMCLAFAEYGAAGIVIASRKVGNCEELAKVIQAKIDKREELRQAEIADKDMTEEEIVAEYERSKQAGARRGNQLLGGATSALHKQLHVLSLICGS